VSARTQIECAFDAVNRLVSGADLVRYAHSNPARISKNSVVVNVIFFLYLCNAAGTLRERSRNAVRMSNTTD
jgi:hypothetical protein